MIGPLSVVEAVILAFYVLAQLADVYTTTRALKQNGAVEANGVIAWLMAKLGRGWILVKLLVSLAAAYAIWRDGSIVLLVGLALLVAAVAVSNYRIAKELEGGG